jgi:hypothetical protein
VEYIGGFIAGSAVPFAFNTRSLASEAITFSGTPLMNVRRATTGAVIVSDLAPTVDVGGATGVNLVSIDTSDDAIFLPDQDYIIAVQQGTVDGVDVANQMLGRFSLNEGILPDNAVSAGAVSAAAVTKIQTGLPTAAQNADALLGRNQMGGSNAAPTVSTALAGGLMRFSINTTTGVMTVLNGDGTTAFTRTLTRADVDAIVSATGS